MDCEADWIIFLSHIYFSCIQVKSKVLPELEKYWKAVNDDPTDFTGWTYLLQYVDQEVSIWGCSFLNTNLALSELAVCG